MKVETIIDNRYKIRIHTLSGEFDFNILSQTIKEIYQDPQFDPQLNSLWDFTNVTGIQHITPDQVNQIVSFVARKRAVLGKIKTSLVVSHKVDFGLARVYELSLESNTDNEVMVFRNLDEALKWIRE
jgi:hypothetical protein